MIRELATAALAACSIACGYPAVHARGVVYDAETQAWQPAVDWLLELQGEAWSDPDWPAYVGTRTDITLELEQGPFNCSGKLADGCAVALGGYADGGDPWVHPGPTVWFYRVQLARKPDVYHTAIGYELAHIYADTHGLRDDDEYMGRFWQQTQSALDAWGAGQ